ncbi:MFS transporter [Humidisolicoccus flavus]|uniref:MFS transporter n=1 Tax=Humidisolicoccus flavus TaxID=3111414 RepID=UPI00324DAE1B
MNSKRSWLVWALACLAYIVAVLHRSSLSVAGPEASARFDISATALSSLAVAQLIVYAALQIPVGVLLDRFGPKALIVAGSLLLGIGQTILAFSPELWQAVGARMLVGAGDACTFISVIRLLSAWFRGPILPQISQWTGNIGQMGQLLSFVPFAALLAQVGWTWAFSTIAIASVGVFIVCLFFLADAPRGVVSTRTDTIMLPASWWVKLRESLRQPGTQLGFWSHFVTQSPGTVFTLLWGYPFLTGALGWSSPFAGALISTVVVTGIVSGPLLGLATARYPLRRSNIVIAIVAVMFAAILAVVLWPGQPPTAIVVIMLVAIGIGGPGSLIGFDFARTFNPVRSLGSANGFVNSGGFLASFVMMGVIGVMLDAVHRMNLERGIDAGLYSMTGFRFAFAFELVILLFGTIMLIVTRRRTRTRMRLDDGITVAPLWIALSRRLRRNSDE